jgi:hypothetical protein
MVFTSRVKNIFTSHIDKKISLTFFLTSLSLYIFTIWKCIAYNRFCRDWIYFDKILISEYKLFKRSNKANLFIALVQYPYTMPRKHDRHLQINSTIPIIPFNVGLFFLYNIPASPAYGVYISQLIRYAISSSCYTSIKFECFAKCLK